MVVCAGRPLLVQPFVSFDSMLQPRSSAIPSRGLQHTTAILGSLCNSPASLQSNLSPAHTSLAIGHHASGCRIEAQRCPASTATITRTAAYDAPDTGRQDSGARRARFKPQAQRHLPQRLPECAAVMGWRVRDATAGDQDIGIVREAITTGEDDLGYAVLRVVNDAFSEQSVAAGGEALEMHLIPFVQPILQRLDARRKVVYVAPPPGLLDIGRRRKLLAYLRPILWGVAKTTARREGHTVAYMPSQRLLVQGGHADLVPLIEAAGGFLEVAEGLQLRSRRRPAGFWDNGDALDRELGRFIAAAWTQHRIDEADASETYFYNQVTGDIMWDAPEGPEEVELDDAGTTLLAEPEGSRVMPSRSTLMAAGRYDLHHAIVYNGGYRAVAGDLGRRPAWPREHDFTDTGVLAAELRAFAKANGVPKNVLPSARMLKDAGRHDLLQAIRELGGHYQTAQALGLATWRRPTGHWQELGQVVAELHAFLATRPDIRAEHRLPTHRELIEGNRYDLRYAVQQHSHTELAAALGVAPSGRGGHCKARGKAAAGANPKPGQGGGGGGGSEAAAFGLRPPAPPAAASRGRPEADSGGRAAGVGVGGGSGACGAGTTDEADRSNTAAGGAGGNAIVGRMYAAGGPAETRGRASPATGGAGSSLGAVGRAAAPCIPLAASRTCGAASSHSAWHEALAGS